MPWFTTNMRVDIPTHFHSYLLKVGAYATLQRDHNVTIITQQTPDGFVCTVKGKEKNAKEVIREIERLQRDTPVKHIAICPSFDRMTELQEYVDELDKKHKGTAFHTILSASLYIIGDKLRNCTDSICSKFPDISSDIPAPEGPKTSTTTAAKTPNTTATMLMEADLFKYIRTFHMTDLKDVAKKYSIKISFDEMGEFAQLNIKGKRCSEAEREIGKLAERLGQTVRTETVAVMFELSKPEIQAMNREFEAKKVVLEYDKQGRCIRIIAHKSAVHQIKTELTSRFTTALEGTESKAMKDIQFGFKSARIGSPRTTRPASPRHYAATIGPSTWSDRGLGYYGARTVDATSFQIQGPSGKFITIHVTVSDITKLSVDAIAKATNSRLCNGDGVAGAIAKAAGPEMTRECQQFTRGNGPLRVTENTVTSAGRLPCGYVIHALGPDMTYYEGKEHRCKTDLERTFVRILERAQERRFRSIAIPAISSGLFGVPIKTVSKVMATSVIGFLLTEPCQLQDVHLVDIDSNKVSLIWKEVNKLADRRRGTSKIVPTAPSMSSSSSGAEVMQKTACPVLRAPHMAMATSSATDAMRKTAGPVLTAPPLASSSSSSMRKTTGPVYHGGSWGKDRRRSQYKQLADQLEAAHKASPTRSYPFPPRSTLPKRSTSPASPSLAPPRHSPSPPVYPSLAELSIDPDDDAWAGGDDETVLVRGQCRPNPNEPGTHRDDTSPTYPTCSVGVDREDGGSAGVGYGEVAVGRAKGAGGRVRVKSGDDAEEGVLEEEEVGIAA